MDTYDLYQTIENRDNADEVERDGPYICRRDSAWLGVGYYYWETNISLAHQWGEKVYNSNYFICQSKVKWENGTLYDLCDTRVLKSFKEYAQQLERTYPQKRVTVPFILMHMRKMRSFQYKAVRVYGEHSFNNNQKIFFKGRGNRGPYINPCPEVQVCVIDKSVIGLENYHIIYPEMYVDGYLV